MVNHKMHVALELRPCFTGQVCSDYCGEYDYFGTENGFEVSYPLSPLPFGAPISSLSQRHSLLRCPFPEYRKRGETFSPFVHVKRSFPFYDSPPYGNHGGVGQVTTGKYLLMFSHEGLNAFSLMS